MARVRKKRDTEEQQTTQAAETHEVLSFDQKIAYAFSAYVMPYWRYYIYGILIVLAAVVIIVSTVIAQRTERARALAQVNETAPLTELQKVANDYEGSAAGRAAAFAVARKQYEQGNYKKAADAYKRFMQTYPAAAMYLKARLGRAYALEADGRLKEAQETFAALAEKSDLPPELQAEAYLGAGRCAHARENIEEARTFYQAAVDLESDSMFQNKAQTALNSLPAS